MTVTLPIAGAFAFGLLIGWYVYFVNRYRSGDIQIADIVTLLGAIGGAAVLALFKAETDLFGAYGVGLATGFFAYFIALLILVKVSDNFDSDWFLDGRRRNPAIDFGYGKDARETITPMALPGEKATVLNYYGPSVEDAAALVSALGTGAGVSMQAMAIGDATHIARVCATTWSASGPGGPFKAACNFYVIEVARRLGVTIEGTADDIIGSCSGRPWIILPDGNAARQAAEQGKFVVAGVKSDEYDPPRAHGHIAIVVPGKMNAAGWAPAGYWGSLSAEIAELGGTGIPISNCFTSAVKDKIVYACRVL